MAWQIDTKHGFHKWRASLPRKRHVARAAGELIEGAPVQWHGAMRHLADLRKDAPEWLACLEALERMDAFAQRYGGARQWNLNDAEICALAQQMADEAGELDACERGRNATLAQRIDTARMVCAMAQIEAPRALLGEGMVKRVQDARWWRRALRVRVARTVEAGAIKLGIVNKHNGAYASNLAVDRRRQQIARNMAQLEKTLLRNEAGQVYTLGELAAFSTANPVIRGGELMQRIRGAEEYADGAAHVGLFLTLTCPSAMHAITVGSGGRPRANPKYDGSSTPRTAQLWLRKTWARTRTQCAREGVRMYGMRVAEPHHDETPHWHALIWVDGEAQAQALEKIVRAQWLKEYGDERGAEKNRVNIKRMVAGGAAGYVAKYIAKSVGHHALEGHIDEQQGQLFSVDTGDVPGYVRVDAWASTWGIRQFQAIGMPPVSVWRELRRVTSDQAEKARVQWRDRTAWAAWTASGATWAGQKGIADWCRYMQAMGGHARGRCGWALRVARRAVPEGAVNQYGEAVTTGRAVGVECAEGHWLISRRIAWARVTDVARQSPAERAQLGAPWTGFNNCTARLDAGGKLRAALLGLRTTHNTTGRKPPLQHHERQTP